MRKILLSTILLFSMSLLAQDNEKEGLKKSMEASAKAVDTTKLGWKRGGNFTFLFNQSAFNKEWQAGGTSNIAGNIGINYDYNYSSRTSVWDNKLIIAYGLTKLKGQETTKSDDRLEFNSLFGKKIGNSNWYYSAFLNFKTQMDSGFLMIDVTNDNGTPLDTTDDFKEKVPQKNSHFFSPAYLQVGPGLLWKKSDNLKVNIAPATSRVIFVHKEFTQDLPEGVTYFGVKGNKTTRFEFGAAVNAYYKLNIMENITWENILNLYSNYLDKPQNIDIDYQTNVVMKINKYISANLAFQVIKDDNASKYVQVREVFGLGVNFGF